MESKLTFLKKYNSSIKIYNEKEVLEIKEIPLEWQNIFKSSLDNRIEKIIKMWEREVKNEMKETILYLKENLLEVDLISFKERLTKTTYYSILYGIKRPNNKTTYYVGEIPYNSIETNDDLDWGKLKKSIKDFYTKLHNGFYYYASESMGLVPIRSLTYFKDYDWGIIDDLKEPLKINIEKTVGFFSNGMGGYVAIDIESDHSVVWFSDDQPKYNISFWSFVDAWIKIGMDM